MKEEARNIWEERIMYGVLPCYDSVDDAHNKKHIINTMEHGKKICELIGYENVEVVLTALAYHDIGMLGGDRDNHHIVSAGVVLRDNVVRRAFSLRELFFIYRAVLEHRTNSMKTTLVSKIVADADKLDSLACIDRMFERSVKYNYSSRKGNIDEDSLFGEVYTHLKDKFGSMGEVKFNIPEVEEMYAESKMKIELILNDKKESRKRFLKVYKEIKKGE